ncbi:NAD-dependent epimerase/dehydratase family protein [Rhodoligotrophos defluvii]|uniref:NAD-dependent epimerase/dehydratase family protein n=1 Tax=Rhodoligotrophos defluvii TaxID=2561934 RepID=UPI0010CA145D|nr:SDR family NAD(P)-dependent oxidoreductase [Rhodoligotrophos defluvii]
MDKVLVTGGCGFIGRHVSRELQEHGYHVRVLDSLVEQVHGAAEDGGAPISDEVEFIRGDMRDADTVARALDGVDGVLHLAAEVGVGQSMYEIARYVGANDLGTAVLLEQMIQRPIKRVVVASSMSVYGEGLYVRPDGSRVGNARRQPSRVKALLWDPVDADGSPLRPVPTDEEKPVDLASIYALTKYAQERQVLIFGEAYGVEAVALRLFNVFGPGQALSNPYTGVLANFAARLANDQPPMIFEDGNQQRDFVHVRDVARAFRLALEQPRASGHVINIGSGKAYSITEVATRLAKAMGKPAIAPDILHKARSGDIRNCFADIAKARDLLGFEPQHRLEHSLAELADWVRSTSAVDRGAEMRRQLEERGLVS